MTQAAVGGVGAGMTEAAAAEGASATEVAAAEGASATTAAAAEGASATEATAEGAGMVETEAAWLANRRSNHAFYSAKSLRSSF